MIEHTSGEVVVTRPRTSRTLGRATTRRMVEALALAAAMTGWPAARADGAAPRRGPPCEKCAPGPGL